MLYIRRVQIYFSQLLAIMYMFIVMQNKKSSSALGSGYYSGSSASSGYHSGSSASSGYYIGSSASSGSYSGSRASSGYSSASYYSGSSSSYYSGSSGTIGHSELTHSKSILGDAIIILQSIYVVDMLNLKSFISPS